MGILHDWEPDRQFMIWAVYIDEADSHKPAPVMGLGGFVSTAEKWKAFDDAWAALLFVNGLSYSHAADLIQKKKQYKGWNAARHNNFVLGAQELINKYIEAGFVTILRRDDYINHYRALQKPRKIPEDTMYGVLFRTGVSFSLQILSGNREEEAKSDVVNIIIESGEAKPGYATQLYDRFKSDPQADPDLRRMLGRAIAFAKKEDAPGCQAVDLMLGGAMRQERLEHGVKPSLIEQSSWADLTKPVETRDLPTYRIPVTRDILESLRHSMFVEETMRREYAKKLIEQSRLRRGVAC